MRCFQAARASALDCVWRLAALAATMRVADPRLWISPNDAFADPSAPPPAARRDSTLDELMRTIEAEIIPRLLLANRMAGSGEYLAEGARETPSAHDVAEFARLAITHDVDIVVSFVRAMQQQGVSLPTVYLDLVAPAARHLGDMWSEDLADFTQVTVGLWRLQQVLHQLSVEFVRATDTPPLGGRVLLCPTPGEQHVLGLVMLGDFLRRDGWDVHDETSSSRETLARRVRCDWFDVLGFSLSCSSRIGPLTDAIRAVRRASLNRSIGVMVGGRVFVEQPELVALVGADAMAADAEQASMQVRNLLSLFAKHS